MLLVLLFPVSFVFFAYVAILLFFLLLGGLDYLRPTSYLTFLSTLYVFHLKAWSACQIFLPLCLGVGMFWAFVAVTEGDRILLDRVGRGVHVLPYFEAEEAHQLLENLCIACGSVKPELYVLEDDSINVFSVGTRPEKSKIVLSRGALKKLERAQLEGVLAQQLAHIHLYDVRMMSMIIMCLAFFTFAGEYLVYGNERQNIESWEDVTVRRELPVTSPIFLWIGAVLLGYGYLLAPLIRCALSRRYQYWADSKAALLTRYPHGLAAALWKISQDPYLEALATTELLGVLCVENPHHKPTVFGRLSGLWESHPPVEERIRALNDMDGLFLQTPTPK